MPELSLNKPRIQSVDLLRGLIMIIMALDHTRDFFHSRAMVDDPLNLASTTPALFFTRWITHFCAPVFVFMAGTSGYLQGLRKDKKTLRLFLLTRGLWLIVADMFIFSFAFSFDIHYSLIALETLWSIGMSMIVLGLFIYLPFNVILVTGLLIVFGHNILDSYQAKGLGAGNVWYSLLHQPGFFPLGKGHNILVLYPFLSWSGLMMLGYCLGRILVNDNAMLRKKILIALSISVILIFIILRKFTGYGDPLPWSEQKNILFTVFSFVNTLKYPPSLLFMCMTIGPALIFLAFFDKAKGKIVDIISVYGRVPFFYFTVHFFLIHFVSMCFFFARGHKYSEGIHPEINNGMLPNFVMFREGFGLVGVYIVWIAIVVIMYPLCKWFDRYKKNNKDKWWLSYL